MSKTDDSILVTHFCEVCHSYTYEWLELTIPNGRRLRAPHKKEHFALRVNIDVHEVFISILSVGVIFGLVGEYGWKTLYCGGCGSGLPLIESYARVMPRLGTLVCRCSKCDEFWPYDEVHFNVYMGRLTRICRRCQEHMCTTRRNWRSFSPDSEVGRQVRAIYDSQEGRCWWCQKLVGDNYHLDHRIPLARGGRDILANLVVSCPECNKDKRAKMPWEFAGRLL